MSLTKKICFAAVAALGILAAVEGLLALTGFNYTRTPRVMKETFVENYISWQNEDIEEQHFIPHPARMWTATPGFGNVNESGYQGPLLPRELNTERLRVLFLGDSCTNAGPTRYPDKTIVYLEDRGIHAESLIAGVGSYSSWQGLEFFREALTWSPEVIVVYFGWNDHWLSAQPDHEYRRLSPLETVLTTRLSRLRIYQLLHRLIHPPLLPKFLPHDSQALLRGTRVPPDRYAENITAMIDLARESGLPIHFIVAPMAPHIVQPSEDKEMLIGYPDLIPEIHSLYTEVLRKTVADSGYGRLVDFTDVTFDLNLMKRDGIHPTEAGYDLIARRLAASIADDLSERLGRSRAPD